MSFESDIYSFGVVLLELISGRRAIDDTRLGDDQNVVFWVSESWSFYVVKSCPCQIVVVLEFELPIISSKLLVMSCPKFF